MRWGGSEPLVHWLAAAVGTWMVTIGASGVRILPIILASFLVING